MMYEVITCYVFFYLQAAEEEKPTDLFTSEGLKPSMDDLDNLFDDSSDETEAVSLKEIKQGFEPF